MYLEFILLIYDYFKSLNKRNFLFEWMIPIIISSTLFYLNYDNYDFNKFATFKDNSINILGVLLGFSIAIITILITGGGKNLEEIKKNSTGTKLNGKNVSLHTLLLVNFSYTISIEILFIFASLIFPLFYRFLNFGNNFKLLLYCFSVFLTLQILLILIRNITDIYLIVTKN